MRDEGQLDWNMKTRQHAEDCIQVGQWRLDLAGFIRLPVQVKKDCAHGKISKNGQIGKGI